MATIASPRKRARFGRKWLWVGGGILLVIVVAGLVLSRMAAGAASATVTGWSTAPAASGSIDATVNATGSVEARAEAELRFASDGTVTEILVQPGDQVQAGQALARIDAADLSLKLDQAAAELKQAQADYDKLRNSATPQEVAEAQARVAQAQAQAQQARTQVTPADIAAAKAELQKAEQRLARLQSGAAGTGDADIAQAQSALEQARTDLAAAKERARLDLEAAANTLRNKQDAYSRIYWDNKKLRDHLARYGQDIPQENKDQEAAALRDVQDAEAAMAKAQIAYEDAKKNEIATLQQREADVRKAQSGSGSDLIQAQADVESARAELARLSGGNQAGNIAAAQAGVAIAQAQLEQLSADPNASDLARAEAGVAAAEAALKQAQRALDQATLSAPFAATVARVDLRVGERAGENGVVAIADLSSFHITVPVDELDVAQVQAGQPVTIVLDALPGSEIAGTVTSIDPLATKSDKGTNTYDVRVAITGSNPAIRSGMTAVAQIVTQRKEGVVLVPRRAVQSENGQSYVLIPAAGQPDPVAQTPASERRAVKVGLSNSESVEIVEGLKAGEQVYVKDVVSTFNPNQPQ
jgi:HlyD family secretion protein